MNQSGAVTPVSGTLALVGGGDYEQSEQVDRFLLELAGGPDTPVVFLPTSHPSRLIGEKFTEYYQSLGVRNVRVAPVYERKDAENEDNALLLREAGLIFIGWGSENRLQQAVTNTPVLTAMEEAYRRGAVLAGTSAGARASGEMVISAANGPVGLREGLEIRPGFNWVPGMVIEAHLSEWNRYGHLLLMGALHPELTWIGIDERTSLVIHPDGDAEVVGSGNVFVARRSPSVLAIPPRPGKALEARGLHLDVLSHGSRTTLDELRRPFEY